MDIKKRKEQELESIIKWANTNRKQPDSNFNTKDRSVDDIANNKDTKLDIEISKDEMEAFIFIAPPMKEDIKDFITFEYIKDKLEESGVKYGVDYNKVKEILDKEIYFTKVKIAEGKEAIDGKDGEIKYNFNLQKTLKPRLSKDGKADFYNLDLVTNIKKDQIIAEIIPPTNGKPGKTVTGKVLPVKNGKKPKLNLGKNVTASEDKMKVFSNIDGQPVLSGSKLSVIPILEIKGDVGTSTGNINFLGTVIVNGSVKSGFKVEAEGDVEVRGVVESATITAKDSIILRRGIQGREKGYLKAGLDIIARYMENTTAEAGRNIHVSEAIMHSNVLAMRKIILDGKRGLLVGGSAKAGEEIIAKTIGSPMCTYTELEVGVNSRKKKNLQEVITEIEKLKKSLEKTTQAIQFFSQLKDKNLLTSEKKQLLEKLKSTEKIIETKLHDLKIKKVKIEDALSFSGNGKISAYDITYAGVNLVIGNSSLKLRNKVEHVTFYNYMGQIKFGPFEG